jgi:hypothetical protein
MPVPFAFSNATTSLPLSQLDANFNTPITLGNTAIQLGNTVTTLNNITLANVTIQSGTSTVGNVTIGNTTIGLGNTATTIGNLTLSNVTISSGSISANASNATSDSVNVVGYMGIPQNIQNGNYNVVIGDAGKHIYHPTGQAAATYTFPANSNVAFTIGTAITIVNGSANAVTVALTTDTLYLSSTGTTGNRTLAQWGIATAVKIASTTWVISGSNLT